MPPLSQSWAVWVIQSGIQDGAQQIQNLKIYLCGGQDIQGGAEVGIHYLNILIKNNVTTNNNKNKNIIICWH